MPGILVAADTPPPVHHAAANQSPAAIGYPFEVQDDGALVLPQLAPLNVAGLSLTEAKQRITDAYIYADVVRPDFNRVVVSLIRKRSVRVVVMREDAGVATTIENNEIKQKPKRGTGHVVDLPAYENDVLHALARTGGLPGTDAVNRVIVERNSRTLLADAGAESPVSVIPLRSEPGQWLPFLPDDVILGEGDVVYLEPREDEFFYTGGLLPAGQFELPRDHDLDVVEAISLVKGTIANGGFQTNVIFQASFIEEGLGGASPSLVIVLRRMPNGGQLPIRVDLNKALSDPQQRINIQPGDVLLLQQTVDEAIARYFGRQLRFLSRFQLWDRNDASGALDYSSGAINLFAQ